MDNPAGSAIVPRAVRGVIHVEVLADFSTY